jgi:hypothetical protein
MSREVADNIKDQYYTDPTLDPDKTSVRWFGFNGPFLTGSLQHMSQGPLTIPLVP